MRTLELEACTHRIDKRYAVINGRMSARLSMPGIRTSRALPEPRSVPFLVGVDGRRLLRILRSLRRLTCVGA